MSDKRAIQRALNAVLVTDAGVRAAGIALAGFTAERPGSPPVTIKTALLAIAAAAALIGAAIIGVPSTSQKSSAPAHIGLRVG